MNEVIAFVIGLVILVLGFFIGNLLAKWAREEVRAGQIWFKLIILVCFIGAVLSLVFIKDYLLFTFLFIAIVTSRSLVVFCKRKKSHKKI